MRKSTPTVGLMVIEVLDDDDQFLLSRTDR